MRILCTSSFFREQGGGVAHVAHLLAREIGRLPGMEVILAAHSADLAAPDASDEPYRRMTIRATNWFEKRLGVPLLLPHAGDVARLCEEARRADALLVHDSVYLANLAALGARPAQIPAIVIKHTGEVRFESRLGKLAFALFSRGLEPAALGRADTVVYVTQAKLENSRPIEGVRRMVIANGIDTDIFSPEGCLRDGSLLFVGRFVPKKGIGIVREMAQLMPNRLFVVAGYGGHDPRGWGLANVVCHWQPDPAKIAQLLSRCDAAIFPGDSEGTPLVALEALACEAPTIVGENARGPDDALNAQMVALKVDLTDPQGTARLWCAELDRAIARSRPNRALIVREYSAQRMARDYLGLIERCAAEKVCEKRRARS